MTTRRALVESLECRRLMSATCTDVLAAELSDAGGAEGAVRRRNLVTLHSFDASVADGLSNTLVSGEAPDSNGAIDDGTSTTILFAQADASRGVSPYASPGTYQIISAGR